MLKHITEVGNMTKLPDWVLQHKKKGIAIETRNGRYYASRVTSVWDPKKGRAKKITTEYLGVVKPEGIIPPKHKQSKTISGIQEAGNIVFIERFTKQLEKSLQEFWPRSWQSILTAAIIKLVYREPLKRLQFRYKTSYTSTLWPDAHLSKNSITQLLEKLGTEWNLQQSFFENISKATSYMAIDITHFFSKSRNISWLEKGYNAQGLWKDQLQLLLLWGLETARPAFLKLLAGTIPSAHTIMNAVHESKLKNVVLIGDKGFFSEKNVDELEDQSAHYILAIKRDLSFLEYRAHSRYKDYFIYRNHAQWWREHEWKGRRIIQYLDKEIAAEEETIFLRKLEKGAVKKSQLSSIKNRFGTLALITDLGLPPKKLYELYKQRREIESAFDTFKNTLEADKTWMQRRESLQGYLFIQFLALYIYSYLLDHLKRKKMLNNYSVHDVLWELSKVYVVKMDEKTVIGEVPKSARRIIEKLEVPITEKLGS